MSHKKPLGQHQLPGTRTASVDSNKAVEHFPPPKAESIMVDRIAARLLELVYEQPHAQGIASHDISCDCAAMVHAEAAFRQKRDGFLIYKFRWTCPNPRCGVPIQPGWLEFCADPRSARLITPPGFV